MPGDRRPKPKPPPLRRRAKSWGHRPDAEAAERLSTTPGSPAAGSLIAGKYRLLEILGEGGMGTIWLARNLTLDIEVAIKLLHPGRATPQAYRRLLQEARAAAQLQHPSIVRVFDFGHDDGAPYIVMEVLSGELLADLLARKGRLPAPKAVTTLLPVIGAIAAAHAKGIVHRDLKPENVLLAPLNEGSLVPKVLDFGIAKFREEQFEGERITIEKTLVGTPQYMSPEQCSWTQTVDARSDVWALSVMLYELATGKPPFDGPSVRAVMMAIGAEQPVPLTELAAGDEELWAVLARGLEKDREARWPTAREFGTALAAWAVRQGVDSDIAGSSIEAHWLTGTSHLISIAPRSNTDPEPALSSKPLRKELAPTQRLDSNATSDPVSAPLAVESGKDERPARSRGRAGFWLTAALLVGVAGAAAWYRKPILALAVDRGIVDLPPIATPAPPSEQTEQIPASAGSTNDSISEPELPAEELAAEAPEAEAPETMPPPASALAPVAKPVAKRRSTRPAKSPTTTNIPRKRTDW
jgi:eukaryotic-like serine/threonine-protein kinase